MKNFLAAAFVVFVASIALSQAPAPPDAPNPAEARQQQRWEYKVQKRGGNADTFDVWEKTLNAAAAEGWELDQINDSKFYIFRRPVEQRHAAQGRRNVEGRLIEAK